MVVFAVHSQCCLPSLSLLCRQAKWKVLKQVRQDQAGATGERRRRSEIDSLGIDVEEEEEEAGGRRSSRRRAAKNVAKNAYTLDLGEELGEIPKWPAATPLARGCPCNPSDPGARGHPCNPPCTRTPLCFRCIRSPAPPPPCRVCRLPSQLHEGVEQLVLRPAREEGGREEAGPTEVRQEGATDEDQAHWPFRSLR